MSEYVFAAVAAVAAGFVMFGGERVPFGLPPMAWALVRGVVLVIGLAALVGATPVFGEAGSRDAYQKALLVLVLPQFVLYLVFNDSFGVSRKADVPGQ